MTTIESTSTESVVRCHLQAFLEQQGIAAILSDFAEGARLFSTERVYRGRPEIHDFFTGFMAALPADAIDRFELISMWVEGKVAYITWRVGSDIPLGTDTFVVEDGKIVAQTFAMYAVPAH